MTTRESTEGSTSPSADLRPSASASASSTPGRRRSHRRWLSALVIALVLVGAVVGLALWRSNSADASATEPEQSLPTAEVQRGTLTAFESRDATITYADTSTLTSGIAGLVTWLPTSGGERGRGRTLARIDEQKLVAMYGTIPAFRTMAAGATGRDVAQLEKNLDALGFDGFTVDDTYTANTAAAVRDWQADAGLPVTGTVPLGQVAFLPSSIQVGAMAAAVGDQVSPGAALYAISTADRIVSATLAEQDRDLAVVGSPVTIDAGSAGTAAGTISSVSAVASTSSQGNQTATTTDYLATIEIDPESEGAADLDKQADGTPVQVQFAAETAEDVLNVPVKALLALAEGGFGVEVVEPDSSTKIVAVTTGLFANGQVEVSGDGLTEGTTVRTAR